MRALIPKTIHYIWFGAKPLPTLAKQCVSSWKEYCPEYEIKIWNESNFDINQNQYCREAFEAQKWAFVSDYVRLWVLANCGGIYLDTDVELLRSFDGLLKNQAFMGFEGDNHISTAVMACEKDTPIFLKLLNSYNNRVFALSDGSFDTTTNVEWLTDQLKPMGLILNGKTQQVEAMTVYSKDYFSPKDFVSRNVTLSQNTYAIHHFDGSWFSQEEKDLILERESLPAAIKRLPGICGVMYALIRLSIKKRSLLPVVQALQREKQRHSK